jgi:hypothetical protein
MPTMQFNIVDATELAETPTFLRHWAAADRDAFNASRQAFLGTPDYTIDDPATTSPVHLPAPRRQRPGFFTGSERALATTPTPASWSRTHADR